MTKKLYNYIGKKYKRGKYMKKLLSIYKILAAALLCCMLLGAFVACNKEIEDLNTFLYTDADGKYNAIVIDFGEDGKVTHYIGEKHGIWEKDDERKLVILGYDELFGVVENVSGDADFYIAVATPDSYRYSIVENYPLVDHASELGADCVFVTDTSTIKYSDDGATATITPNDMTLYYLGEDAGDPPSGSFTMTKVLLPEEDIIPFDTLVDEMELVPKEYYEFIKLEAGVQYHCDEGNFAIDGETMTGLWSNPDDEKLSIRMEFNKEVPYIDVYDTTGENEVIIFSAYLGFENNGIAIVEETPNNRIFVEFPENIYIKKVW